MEDLVLVNDVDEEGEKNILSTPTRQRTKKKSTLAKLKEKKQREFGSNTSLQAQKSNTVSDISGLDKTANGLPAKSDYLQFSTKEPKETVEESKNENKPRPKPRSRKQSDLDLTEKMEVDKEEKNKSDEQVTHQKNLMSIGKSDSGETSTTQGMFVPKPPLTPRTPKSTPRTPRGYVLPGKGEKRNREPWSSGDEPEVEEKKEKSQSNENIKGSSGNLQNLQAVTDSSQKFTRQIPGQVKPGERLLKRRNSKDNRSEDSNDLKQKSLGSENGKPPINRSLTSLNGTNINNSSTNSYNEGIPPQLTHISPREKFLKSSKNTKRNSFLKQRSISHDKGDLDSADHHSYLDNMTLEKDPSNKSLDSLHAQYERLLLTDIDSENKQDELVLTSETPLMKKSVSSPSKSRLQPVSPKTHPPPLSEEFSSKSLRTSYKIDFNVPKTTETTQNGAVKSESGPHSGGDRLSQKSFASGSILPVITTKEARARFYPVGTGSSTLLVCDEFDRYFPDRKVSVFVGTWNMNELKDVETIEDFILPKKCDYVQDIYAIGTQENAMNKKEWEIKLQETLGPSHVMYHSVSHGSLHLVVFIRRDLIWFCSEPEDDIISLRALTMVKTKGAIGMCMTLFGTSYLFINCHLTSDRDNDTSRKINRIADYFKVIQEMKLPKSKTSVGSPKVKKPGDVSAFFDCVFWFGDLNFRLERERQAVVRKVDQITSEEIPNFEALLGGDQLLKFMTEEKIFGGFQEGRINFHPTFKFDLNKDSYDSSAKSRVPSYTDRIMFRSKKKNEINCLQYDAVMEIKISDHRPVFGRYETGIQPGKDNLVYSAGHFDRAVYLEANKRRATAKPGQKKQSVICTLQ
ncbi:phosphatidylinositol polyphosphate 5-phosphatase type IV-like [Physella acuta]|uniref:phosphatidylinositol polyphosphate 5-phosphatase type IV-like n=1 Tax=Physella acuta TaxID=109671 RepID=UPI0027DDDCFC|nr:phosphatidylinositol polyphosphate 5-phosphatase type IV-like [Physella acuta]XP_059152157.1 phosphatidylinositol polyphosphate 5-phosphatase type IV-like [Physella acuta]